MTDMRFAGDAILALELTVMLALPALCRTVPGFAQRRTAAAATSAPDPVTRASAASVSFRKVCTAVSRIIRASSSGLATPAGLEPATFGL